MIQVDRPRSARELLPSVERLFALSAAEDSIARTELESGRRRPGVHGPGPIPGTRLDRMDRRVSVRIGAVAVRRDGRTRVPRAGPLAHDRSHGHPPDACRCARSRLQQRQHIREPVASRPRGTDRGDRMGGPLLRARAEGERGGAGATLDGAAGRRVHPFVQRTALAFRGYDPVAAIPGARSHAGPAVDGGTGLPRQPARSAGRARTRNRPLQRLFRPRPRPLRCPGAHGARKPVQRDQRHLPRPELAAGLLAVHDLDAWSCLGDARICRADRIPARRLRTRRSSLPEDVQTSMR